MDPTLHQWYMPDEAVAAIGDTATPEFLCDDQFVFLSQVVLCFATVGDAATESHVSCPSCVVWRPNRLDYATSDEYPWLPEKVREVWDRSQKEVKKIRDHHVFLRLPADVRFFYAGKAHLGSYGGPMTGGTPADRSANFSLNEKLPRDIWLRFGGYPGWLIDVNHRTQRVENGDLRAFRQLIEELPHQEFSHLCMTRYEEDSLTLHTNARRGWLMYLREPANGGIYTRDPEYAGNPKAEEIFRCACGIDLEFSADQTLPRDLAIRAAEEFFVTGDLPECVHWSAERG